MTTGFVSTPQYYRGRALEMLKLAERAPTDAVRGSYLDLAACWMNLAEQTEKGGGWHQPQEP